MTQDILSGGEPQDSASNVVGGDILTTLVGEDKPFKTVEDLAKGKAEADRFIATLKAENADMRKVLEGAETTTKTNELLQNLMARLEQAPQGGTGNQSQTPLTREDIVKIVQGQVTEETRAQARTSNRMRVNAEVLRSQGGDEAKARAFVTAKSQELGIDRQQLTRMAEETPLAFLAVMGLGQAPKGQGGSSPLAGLKGSNPPVGADGSDGVTRNYAFYKKLRKELGSKYYEPHIQQQLIKDRKALGENFFDKP